MRIRIAALSALSALALGAAACSEPEQEAAEANTEDAGSALQEEAAQVGSASRASMSARASGLAQSASPEKWARMRPCRSSSTVWGILPSPGSSKGSWNYMSL